MAQGELPPAARRSFLSRVLDRGPRIVWMGEHYVEARPLDRRRLTVWWMPRAVRNGKILVEGTVYAEGLTERSPMNGHVERRRGATIEYRMAFASDGVVLELRLVQRLCPVTIRTLTELRGTIEPALPSGASENRIATLRLDWRKPWPLGRGAR